MPSSDILGRCPKTIFVNAVRRKVSYELLRPKGSCLENSIRNTSLKYYYTTFEIKSRAVRLSVL